MAPVYSRTRKLHPFLPLSALPERICATEPRLVLPHSVTLQIRRNQPGWLFPDAFQVTCANTGVGYFRCQEKMGFVQKTILWDIVGTPVLHLKKSLSCLPSPSTSWIAFAGKKSNKMLVKLKARRSLFPGKITVTADFPDACTGRVKHLVLKWNYWKEFGVVYAGKPKHGGVPIAKMYNRSFSRNFYVDIASEVDIALVVAMCLAAINEV